MNFSALLPEHYPKTVYKYRDWSNDFHKKTLINMELFLASPALFNDPIDCKIPIAYYKLKDDPELTLKYFEGYVARHYPKQTESQRQSKVQELIKEGKYYKQEWIEWQEQEQFRQLSDNYGIISFSQHKDNILLWSHYASSHTGYCIGFKSYELFFNQSRFGNGGKVMYEDELPVILPTEDLYQQLIKQIYTKSTVWSYEDEYRVTKSRASNQTVGFTQNEVAEIIIGSGMKESEAKSVVSICKCNFPEIPIFKTTVVPRTFKLDFKQIN